MMSANLASVRDDYDQWVINKKQRSRAKLLPDPNKPSTPYGIKKTTSRKIDTSINQCDQ